jgi:ketosteroid isomerase-like protein
MERVQGVGGEYHASRLRRAARWAALAAVPLLLVWLLPQPDAALRTLWYVVIPILPATFFLSTALWRSICPLATLNELGNRIGTQRAPSPGMLRTLSIGGLTLFYLLVPARHYAFNQHGPLLAGTVVAVGALALLLGARFTVRSGFCNALCPILPVELLYGQAPLLDLARGRCPSCEVCTPRGCLDLTERKALPQLLGSTRKSAQWLATPYGAFFAALPGFIVGYNQVPDGPPSSALMVYGITLGWSLLSLLLVAGIVLALRLGSKVALALVAAAAGALYYWYAGPAIARQFGSGMWLGSGIRAAGFGLVGFWLIRALLKSVGEVGPSMKPFAVILLLATLNRPALGQSAPDTTAGQLIALEQQWNDAILRNDSGAAGAFMAEEWTEITTEGEVLDRTADLAELVDGYHATSLVLSGLQVQRYGDVALVSGVSDEKSSYKGKDTSGRARWMDVWVRRAGRWICVKSTVSPMAEGD